MGFIFVEGSKFLEFSSPEIVEDGSLEAFKVKIDKCLKVWGTEDDRLLAKGR